MKTIETDNKALLEVLTDNGITITCNADMQVTMTDEDAAKVAEIVNRYAPAAAYDYVIKDMPKYIVYYNDEVNEPADVFTADTLDECTEWITNELEGMNPVTELYDDRIVNSSKTFYYEVYDKPIVETNGSEFASDWIYNDPVYTTDYYYTD